MSQSQEKPIITIPELEETYKQIKEKLAVLANISSVGRPYTNFDRMYFDDTLGFVTKSLSELVDNFMDTLTYMKASRPRSLLTLDNPYAYLQSYTEALSRLYTIAEGLDEIDTLLHAYVNQYNNHT